MRQRIVTIHVVAASVGRQIFEDADEAACRARAVQHLDALLQFDASSPVTIWTEADIREVPDLEATG